ncbi:acetate--CoA ligase family protein [Candidatus Daviesbacteria bacterium]|nr:acetate--CoA ligase family protein [Candidatus Daviesbacteria bacterium]
MILYEFEGKQLFKNCGINVPQSQLVTLADEEVTIKGPCVLKVQVLSGKRADVGGIVTVKGEGESVKGEVEKLFGRIVNGEKVDKVLVEEMVDYDREYYLSFSYSTESRGPVLNFGEGGTGVEGKEVKTFQVDILKGYLGENVPEELKGTAKKLWEVFTKYDCELAEINPLVVAKNPSTRSARSGQNYIMALDAKIILDDDADFRREIKFPERNLFGRAPTEAEIEARKIDEGDHRGTAGSVYWDLEGDIAVIAAGGGGSIVNMDALVAYGGKSANYTEHSGNPPREKLERLTKIVLSKPNLKGCWFVGGTANFTDIFETLMGFVEGLRELSPKPNYPIVIRRGGPRDKEAFEALKEIGEKEGFDFHIYGRETPMTATAKTMVDLAYGNTSY